MLTIFTLDIRTFSFGSNLCYLFATVDATLPHSTGAGASFGFALVAVLSCYVVMSFLPGRVLVTVGGNPAHGRYEHPGGLYEDAVTLPSGKKLVFDGF
jgi:hypothetical protein